MAGGDGAEVLIVFYSEFGIPGTKSKEQKSKEQKSKEQKLKDQKLKDQKSNGQ
ncbi:hypothetical protein [Methanosarcina sp. KYL-1]|uniref:hypothetical protein n=1 Tax=Methanosarcina sp. KYL-1 TaxID=2602068 RepID=UPI002101CB8D|nr:hypothetical protein [Methanosarcina sp. KYL-1]